MDMIELLIITFLYSFLIISAINGFLKIKFCIKKKKPKLNIILEFNKIKIEGVIKMFSLKLRQRVKLTLRPIDSNGDPAPIEAGSAVFNSTEPEVMRIELIPEEPESCWIYSGVTGVATIEYSADADLGEGVKTITGSSNGEVIPREAVGFGVAFGEPEDV